MWIDLLAGVVIGALLMRAGMNSPALALMGLSILGNFSTELALGLVGACIWHYSLHSNRLIAWQQKWIPWGVGMFACLLLSQFLFLVRGLELIIFPLLLAGTISLLIFGPGALFARALAMGSMLLLGWFALHVWVFPFALLALLAGLFGWRSSPTTKADWFPAHVWRDSLLGVGLGILPGLGPGLVGLFWPSLKQSPALQISNYIFSLGFVVLTGNVRSVHAQVLSGSSLDIFSICILLIAIACMCMGLEKIIPFIEALHVGWWSWLQGIGIAFLGGLPGMGLLALAWVAQQWLRALKMDPNWGLFVLVGPILWFYA
jgi:hypothetical protein